MRPGEWKTRDGRVLLLASMDLEHLRRVGDMLLRQARQETALIDDYDWLGGDHARELAGESVGEAMVRRHAFETKRAEVIIEINRRTSPGAISPVP